MLSPFSLNSGARSGTAGFSFNCTGEATSRKGVPVAVCLAILEVPVGSVRVQPCFYRDLDPWRPGRGREPIPDDASP
jgi:hypothetical protein